MQSRKKLVIIVAGLFLAALLFVVGCGGTNETDQQSQTPKTEETKKAMEGTLYLPGMGGHIAVVNVEIDPSNAESPIKIVGNLDKINLGPKETNATHDIRIDKDRGTAYSAAYVKGADGKIRVDKINLDTLEKELEVTVDPSDKYVGGPMYCASGQSKDMFLPVMMGYEGWIDVFDKEKLELKHRVLFGDQITKEYIFAHGVQTPDMTQFLLSLNATSAEKAGKEPPRDNPDILLYLLDMADLEQGKLTINKSGKAEGDPTNSISFRQTFTSDGKYLLQSARDRVLVIDGKTLETVRKIDIPKELDTQIEVHDIMPTADDKYGVMALRVPVKVEGVEETLVDGRIQLMDIEKGELIGEPVSVCRACHEDYSSLKAKKAVLCGIDGTWND